MCLRLLAVLSVALAVGCAAEELSSTTSSDLTNPNGNAGYCPADYDGDGLTDFAVKGSNGIWYIDLASCSCQAGVCGGFGQPETNCSNYIDDDNDGYVNDGCPPVGTGEDPALGQCTSPFGTVSDDDQTPDSFIDDGCPVNPGCLGTDGLGSGGFGGRWDFAYSGYGDATAIPVPADYGSLAGPADRKADLAVKDSTGFWGIDFADNGFGTWDLQLHGYGDASAIPFPADYDGDGKADLAIWTTNNGTTYGQWYFDYSSDGFNGWNAPCANGCPCTVSPGPGYVGGYGTSQDTPAVADFNGDGCADLSLKTANGDWFFDLMGNGFGWEPPCPNCSVPLPSYGGNTYKPAVADYDGDGKADLAVLTPDGYWTIDFAWDGFGTWNIYPFYWAGWGGGSGTATLLPGHYLSKTGFLDQAEKDVYGNWYIDAASSGYGNLDYAYSTTRTNVDTNHVSISGTSISTQVVPSSCGNGTCGTGESCVNCALDCGACVDQQGHPIGGNYHDTLVDPNNLKIGVRYTASVSLAPGSSYVDNVSIRVNPDLHVPASLNVVNIGGHILDITHNTVASSVRRVAFTCSQWGSFPLGFMLYDDQHRVVNPDYGLNVVCTTAYSGLYGIVTDKRTNRPIQGATIKVNGVQLPNPTDINGFWTASNFTSGPYQVEIAKGGYSSSIAVNVKVPGYPVGYAGIEIDTPLEEAFNLPTGITYTTYIDYSRGRTIMHTVRIDMTAAPITFGKVAADQSCTADVDGCGGCWGGPGSDFMRLRDVATQQNASVMINGIWWMVQGGACTQDADCGPSIPCVGGVCQPNYVQTGTGSPTCEAGCACGYRAPGPLGQPADYTRAIGYFYANGFVAHTACANGVCRPADVECASGKYFADPVANRSAGSPVLIQDEWKAPMFAIKGTGTAQRASIFLTDSNFLTSNDGWKRVSASNVPGCTTGFLCPVYDKAKPTNGVSDYNYALQMGHLLLKNDPTLGRIVIARGVAAQLGTAWPGEIAFARTTVGTNLDGTVTWFVIADGEGIDGGNGATANQMGQFYRDVLGAYNAMIIDSGESTELILKGANGPRRVNTLTSENNAADGPNAVDDYCPSGRVFGYIKAGS